MYNASLDVEFNFTSNKLKVKAIEAIFTENRDFLIFQITHLIFIEFHQNTYRSIER